MDKPNILQREPLACLVSSVEEGGAEVGLQDSGKNVNYDFFA